MLKIATIVGARPQFIKASAIQRALVSQPSIRHILIHTGQHFDNNMSDIFFQGMDLQSPDYHLGIGGCSHGAMTGRMLEAIEQTLVKESPDWVLVYGDTNSTLAGVLASTKLHIPVAHVEAGLRSFNRKMPEEINRIVADQCSDLLFTPTDNASQLLIKEGIPKKKIFQVGDVMYDTALHYGKKLSEKKSHLLDQLQLSPKNYVLATVHRAENTDDSDRLKEIFFGLEAIAKKIPVVIPLHPRTKKVLEKQDWFDHVKPSLTLIDPVGYLEIIQLEIFSKVILTDSAGMQKEAYFFKVPCLTLRDETEWVELLEDGHNTLVPCQREEIAKRYFACCDAPLNWGKSFYGQGEAANAILDTLITYSSATKEQNILNGV